MFTAMYNFIICRNQFGQVQNSDYWIGLNKLDRSKGTNI